MNGQRDGDLSRNYFEHSQSLKLIFLRGATAWGKSTTSPTKATPGVPGIPPAPCEEEDNQAEPTRLSTPTAIHREPFHTIG